MTWPLAANINTLPPELLAHIFDASGYALSKDKRALLQLATVCKHWRDILFDYPHFWTELDLAVPFDSGDDDGASNRLVGILDRWFGRSGEAALRLTLRYNKTPKAVEPVHRYLTVVTRWKSLVLKCGSSEKDAGWISVFLKSAAARASVSSSPDRPCWPSLEELEVHAASAVHERGSLSFPLALITPTLRKFAFTAKAIEGPLFSVFANFSWTNLTHFDMWAATDADHPVFILHILDQAPNLEDLRVAFLPNPRCATPESLPTDQPIVIHEKLQHLGIHVTAGIAVSLLRHLRLPALTSLDIATRAHGKMGLNEASSAFVDAYQVFLLESRCEIKAIRLQWVPRSIEDFNHTIGGCKALESVELEDFGCSTAEQAVYGHGRELMFGFCRLLQEIRDMCQEPLAKVKKLSYATYGFGVVLEEGQEDFTVLKREPINWWRYRRFNNLMGVCG